MVVNSNDTDGIADNPRLYIMPLQVQLAWISMFLIVTLVGTIGNLIVIWIVLAHRSMRTVANFFIVNLALADTLSALLNVIVTSYGEIFLSWPFGRFYCKFNEGIASISVCVSVTTMAVLSIERYNAIITPFKPRMKRPTALLNIILIWCISILVTIPHWYFIELEEVLYNNELVKFCSSVWHEINQGELLRSIYSIIFMVLTYFLPLTCMSITYGHVAINLWHTQAIGEVSEHHLKQKRSKQKVVKMMILVVIMFAICWMPMHLYFIFVNSNASSPVIDNFYLALFWLAMSNSMYNPIIYYCMNDKFRTGFIKAFQWCLCQLRKRTEIKM